MRRFGLEDLVKCDFVLVFNKALAIENEARFVLSVLPRSAESYWNTSDLSKPVGDRCQMAFRRIYDPLNQAFSLFHRLQTASLWPVASKTIRITQRNEALVRALAEIVYDWSAVTGQRHWDGDFTRILGYSSEEMGGDQESWRSRVHPDDLPRALGRTRSVKSACMIWSIGFATGMAITSGHDRGLVPGCRGKTRRMVGVFRDNDGAQGGRT